MGGNELRLCERRTIGLRLALLHLRSFGRSLERCVPVFFESGLVAGARSLSYPEPKKSHLKWLVFLVLRKGLEPLHLSAHAPQACVSTNSTT